MAHLEVEPKKGRPWWIWLLTVIVLIALAMFLLRKCDAEHSDAQRAAALDSTSKKPVDLSGPDWKAVDFATSSSSDADITDSEIQTRNGENYTIYTLGENILFPTGATEISETGQSKLKLIGEVLNTRYQGATIGVFGATDSTGTEEANKALGQQRAEAVKSWLSANANVPAEAITVRTVGETKPVASNETPAGRKQNRNVSIVVFPKK